MTARKSENARHTTNWNLQQQQKCGQKSFLLFFYNQVIVDNVSWSSNNNSTGKKNKYLKSKLTDDYANYNKK